MKIRVVLFVFFFCINNFSQTVVSPHFIELKGIEDHQGNTHLFCRVFGYKQSELYFDLRNDIFHIDLSNYVDTLFFHGYQHTDPVSQSGYGVGDYDFWNSDFTKFIFSGSSGGTFEPGSFIKRFDSEEIYFDALWGGVGIISISKQDDSLIFAGAENLCCSDGFQTIKSTDGGWNWFQVSDSLQFISLSPFNDKVMFSINNDGMLYKSTDGGDTFYLSDTRNYVSLYDDFLFDGDRTHIYKLYFDSPNFRLLVSDNLGDYGSWQEEYLTDSNFVIFADTSISGSLFLAEGNTINQSMNYGETFYPLATLESDVIGMYKKPNSDKLYAATKYRIYEVDINYDSLKIIKSITLPSENFDWLPLDTGNYWVYKVSTSGTGQTGYLGDETKKIIGSATLDNGLDYFLYKYTYINGGSDTAYIRLDSLSGKIYAYSFEEGEELLCEDLSAEAGDTVCYEYNPAFNCQYVQPETEFSIFELNTFKKEYYPEAPGWYFGHSFIKGIGLYQTYNGDFTTYSSTLKGCIINGIVYGDTSVVTDVDNSHPNVYSYKLEQNYPNPFNPTTKIKYTIANVGASLMKPVRLIVFDVLGKEVATLVNEQKPAGSYVVEFDASLLPSGVYFYQLKAGSFVKTNKMILLR